MADPVYDSCSAFMAEMVRHGTTDVVISPGSRSTPLAITAHHQPGLQSWIMLDERSAGFFALGLGRIARRPVALICTSGTAAANYLPAVIEANHSSVPLVVLTADRPPELRSWGAGQTIDQVGLYGPNVRWFAETPVVGEVSVDRFARYAWRAVEVAGRRRGPVHLNCPLREPLDPTAWTPHEATLPDVASPRSRRAAEPAAAPEADRLAALIEDHERGLLVVGPIDDPGLAESVAAVAELAGWPVIAEPTSQMRAGPHTRTVTVVSTIDHLLKVEAFASRHRPEVVVRLGMAPTCKPLRLWLERHPPDQLVLVDPNGQWQEPSFTMTETLTAPPVVLFDAVADRLRVAHPRSSRWLQQWRRAERLAAEAIGEELEAGPFCEPSVVRALIDALPAEAVLVVSNSMPVRDLDAFMAAAEKPLRVWAHRGASGIDGLVSSALGAAAAATAPVALLTGDLAFLHDVSGLVAARRLGLDLTIVVVDNNGGAIFSFLPIAAHGEAVSFDTLFRTPHETDLATVAALAGTHRRAGDRRTFADAMSRALAEAGTSVVEVPVDPAEDLAQHRRITSRVADALAGSPT